MDITRATPLLGGLTPQQFMRRHWQKKPLLVRQAMAFEAPPIGRAQLFELAADEAVESRLIVHAATGWTLRHGPLSRRALPSLRRGGWTLLLQGLDQHLDAAHALLSRFRFVPDARLDDLMVSYASDGGGVGAHVDSYDVFLLQLQGRRRWRIGRARDTLLQPGVPLKLLSHFEAEQEWLLEAGDMLYLPPRWAHDGVAEGECMTASIGFRAPARAAFGRELLQCLLDGSESADADTLYRDPAQPATEAPGRIPEALREYADAAVRGQLADTASLDRALGELLTEPKQQVWFERGDGLPAAGALRLDRRSRMMYDARHLFLNGEAYFCSGRDATLLRRLADRRVIDEAQWRRLSGEAMEMLAQWCRAGWLQPQFGVSAASK